jgi:hypothetical protein
MVKLTFPLVLLVILVSCEKKMQDKQLSNSEQNLVDIRSSNSLTNVVVVAQAPPASISDNLTVQNPGGSDITVISASDYNALEPKDQIYYTAVKNSIQYLFQENQSSTLQFNNDGSYSISINGNLSGESENGISCTICGLMSAYSCKEKVEKYMEDHHLTSITVEFTITNNGCVKATVKPYMVFETVPDNGGTVVETYNPSATYSNSDFDSYIQAVKSWGASHQGSGPSGGGPIINNPLLWTRQDLIIYIGQFNNDSSHLALAHQYDTDFQTQLAYYVNYVMPDHL